MPKDPINYSYTEGGVIYDFYDVFVPGDYFRTLNSLWTWGDNINGQLGINLAGSTTYRTTPVTTFAGTPDWKQIASGYGHMAGIKNDGTLWVWGYNYYGQLGNNLSGNAGIRCTPVTTFTGGTNWLQVACSHDSTAAIKTDGTLWTWGRNTNGQIGDNTTNDRCTPVTTFAGGINWSQVTCGYNNIAAIKTDGTLWTWGSNIDGQLGDNTTNDRYTPVTTFSGGTNWKQVFAGTSSYQTAAIKTDGTLWMWGNNFSGQLGINNTVLTSCLTPITTFSGGTNWKQVSCGRNHTSAIKTDGTLWCWGSNSGNQTATVGDNTTNDRCTPVTTFAGGTNWKQVSCGYNFNMAIKTDGTLWGWGSNYNGNLGANNTTSPICTPITTFAGGTYWRQVACGYYHTASVQYLPDPTLG